MRITRYCCASLLAALAVAAAPASAGAKSGWMLSTVASQQGDRVFTSVAWHCGPDPFGTYRFKNATEAAGKRGWVVFKLKLTADGAPTGRG